MAGYKLTKQQIKEEIIKCGRDPIYFIDSYCKVSHPIKGLIPFKIFPYQKKLLKDYKNFRFNVILKARQLGVSTITAAYGLWMLLFHRGKEVVVVATKRDTAANLLKKTKLMYKHLPFWLKISDKEKDAAYTFGLLNGSLMKALSATADAGRSDALSLLIIDEAAIIPNAGDIWTSAYSTLATGGRCVICSSPFGTGNFFHKMYMGASEGSNDFNALKLMWYEHPDRDQEWFERETKNMTKRAIAQEHCCNFNMSGETVFDSEDIERIEKSILKPKYKTGFDRNFWIWKQFDEEKSYLMVGDVARGDGQDFSVFHVFELKSMELVAEYRGKLPPDQMAQMLMTSASEYGKPMIVVENNQVGFTVLQKLIDYGYPNIYYSEKGTHDYVEQHEAEVRKGTVPGFTTSLKTRPLIIAKMEEYIRNKVIRINSERLLNEMKTFVWNNGRPEAMRSYHDDLILACAIGCWVRDTALTVNKRELEYTKAFLGGMSTAKKTIDTRIRGMDGYVPKKNNGPDEETVRQMKEFLWVYKG